MLVMENKDNLDYRKFTSRSESDKAINSLKGILTGINIDNHVNIKEIEELQSWCKNYHELIDRNPFREFMLMIQELTKSEIGREEIIGDLFWLCQKYENENFFYKAITSDLQTLQGVCHGILSDGIITDLEIFSLNKWLDSHIHLTTNYPYDEISSLVLSIVSDGKVTEEERKRLKAYFNEFVKLTSTDITNDILEDIKDINIAGICTSNPDIDFDGKTFAFTGLSKRAPRNEIAKQINDLGGLFINNVSSKTNYLIVGESENPCWAFACYGRKVEKAVTLRKEGHLVSIIHEFDFWDCVEELK
jgi:NAD-dependent DNA ligase